MYREAGIKLDAGDKLIIERLTKIEGLSQTILVARDAQSATSSTSPITSNGTTTGSDDMNCKYSCRPMVPKKARSIAGLASWTNLTTSISAMPRVNTTPALNLLNWPLIRDLVARPYNPRTLLQLEMARELFKMAFPAVFNLSHAPSYIESFFKRVNVWYACVNPRTWSRYYSEAVSLGFQEGAEGCVILLVLTLGSASQHGSITLILTDREPPGLSYLMAA